MAGVNRQQKIRSFRTNYLITNNLSLGNSCHSKIEAVYLLIKQTSSFFGVDIPVLFSSDFKGASTRYLY